MKDVLSSLLFRMALQAFEKAIGIGNDVDTDMGLAHAIVQQHFGDVTLEEGIALIRKEPSHKLRSVADWVESARAVRMSAADEYRDASAGEGRAALNAQRNPSIDNVIAWSLCKSRFARAQLAYPLSRPVEPTARSRRIKAAVALTPDDFSPEAQAAIVELSGGDADAGRLRLAALVAEGQDPGRHITAILAKLDDDHWRDVNELAKQIARKAANGGSALVPSAALSASAAAPAAVPINGSETRIEEPRHDDEVNAAARVLRDWLVMYPSVAQKFCEQDGVFLPTEVIIVPKYRHALDIAGRSPDFQAFLREQLGGAS